jgi:hypothetical protein
MQGAACTALPNIILDGEAGGFPDYRSNVNRLPFSFITGKGDQRLRGRWQTVGVSSLDAGSSSLVMRYCLRADSNIARLQDEAVGRSGAMELLQSGEIDAGLQRRVDYSGRPGFPSLCEPRQSRNFNSLR